MENRKTCDTFFCYRDSGAEIAKNLKKALESLTNEFGHIWYSDQENIGNFDLDVYSLINSSKMVVLFISSDFTHSFLTAENKNNYPVDIDKNKGCVTVKELVAIEKRRQADENYIIVSVNINGYTLSDEDRAVIRQVFLNENILKEDSIAAYSELNTNPYDTRKTDVDEFAKNFAKPFFNDNKSFSKCEVDVNSLELPSIQDFFCSKELFDQIDEDVNKFKVINIYGPQGSGKSSLIYYYLRHLKERNYLSFKNIYYHIFNENENDLGNIEQFVNGLFSFFGLSSNGDIPTDAKKIDVLIENIKSRKTLLILDEFDVFYQNEKIENPVINKFVFNLLKSGSSNDSFCLILLSDKMIDAVKSVDTHFIAFDGILSRDNALSLIKNLGIVGEEKKLLEIAEYSNYNPGTIVAYCNELKDNFNSKASNFYHIRNNKSVLNIKDKRYQKISKGITNDIKPIISLMVLFRRAVNRDLLFDICTNDKSPVKIKTEHIERAIKWLKANGVLTDNNNVLSLSLSFKNYFQKEFESSEPDLQKSYFAYLGEFYASYYDDSKIDTIEEMNYLYDAIYYYASSKKYKEALDILWYRVYRERQFYSQKHLGTFTNDLYAISLFFDEKDWRLVAKLNDEDSCWLRSAASYLLYNNGEFQKSSDLRKGTIEIYKKNRIYSLAASDSNNLASNLMYLGKFGESLKIFKDAQEIVSKASGDQNKNSKYSEGISVNDLSGSISYRMLYLLFLMDEKEELINFLKNHPLDDLNRSTTSTFYYCYINRYIYPKSKENVKLINQLDERSKQNGKAHEISYAKLLLGIVELEKINTFNYLLKINKVLELFNDSIKNAEKFSRIDQIPVVFGIIYSRLLGVLSKHYNKKIIEMMKYIEVKLDDFFSFYSMPYFRVEFSINKIRFYLLTDDKNKAKDIFALTSNDGYASKYFKNSMDDCRKRINNG